MKSFDAVTRDFVIVGANAGEYGFIAGAQVAFLLRRAFEGAVVEAARRAHLPHTRHGLQQRATHLPSRDFVD